MSYGWQKFMQATTCLVSPHPISERLDGAAVMLLTLSASADANVPGDMKPIYASILKRLDKHESLTFDEKSSLCTDIFECLKKLHENNLVAGREEIVR